MILTLTYLLQCGTLLRCFCGKNQVFLYQPLFVTTLLFPFVVSARLSTIASFRSLFQMSSFTRAIKTSAFRCGGTTCQTTPSFSEEWVIYFFFWLVSAEMRYFMLVCRRDLWLYGHLMWKDDLSKSKRKIFNSMSAIRGQTVITITTIFPSTSLIVKCFYQIFKGSINEEKYIQYICGLQLMRYLHWFQFVLSFNKQFSLPNE